MYRGSKLYRTKIFQYALSKQICKYLKFQAMVIAQRFPKRAIVLLRGVMNVTSLFNF